MTYCHTANFSSFHIGCAPLFLAHAQSCEAKINDTTEDAVRAVNDRARCAVKSRGFEAAGEQTLS
jgi:hypothetical protein